MMRELVLKRMRELFERNQDQYGLGNLFTCHGHLYEKFYPGQKRHRPTMQQVFEKAMNFLETECSDEVVLHEFEMWTMRAYRQR